MSDTVQIVNTIVQFLGVVFAGVMAYFMARLKIEQVKAEAASKDRFREAKAERKVVQETQEQSSLALIGKLDSMEKKVDTGNEKIEVIHKATNSIKDELVAATGRAARAEGLAEGLQQGRTEERAP